MPKYVKAEPGPRRSVIYTDSDGKQWIFEGGSRPSIKPYTTKAQIKAVRKDKKGTIQSYLIEGYGWVSKSEAITLAINGKVDAVVATSPRGNSFLRARPNHEIADNLENKG